MEATTRTPPKRRRREETRRRLLTSALGVFARNGYERATVDEIVRDAGFSKGAFYVHFKSKDDLFWTMLEQRVLHHQDAFRQSIDPDSSFRQNVRRLLTAIFDLECGDPRWPAIVMEFVAHAGRNDEVRKRFATIYKRWREFVVAMLREGQAAGQVRADLDLDFAASAAIALIDGTITQSRLAPNEIILADMVDPLCALLAQALEVPD
ncbi:MAG: TetR/AcrR family transcriptional regulator [Dehalococcoidia bacterium]